jgi:hypothetical protein
VDQPIRCPWIGVGVSNSERDRGIADNPEAFASPAAFLSAKDVPRAGGAQIWGPSTVPVNDLVPHSLRRPANLGHGGSCGQFSQMKLESGGTRNVTQGSLSVNVL